MAGEPLPKSQSTNGSLGTMAVFMTAISTILGAILFLRFGYAVAHVGLIGTLMIILIGHLVTIPTALAMAEVATNKKVEGGGAYYMISRSFGFDVGASIGIALFLSQAISVAFYVIAFAISFQPVSQLIYENYGFFLTDRMVGLIFMGLLSILMLSKGANIGVKALYLVVAVLGISIGMFLFGEPASISSGDIFATIEKPDSFFYVFTIIFPAFTGIAAGLGLSGDLKDPQKSIPRGTILATIVGILVYIAVTFKLFLSANISELANIDDLVMQKIAIWPPIIPIGLGCAAISSALGSIMIAPRTLQALGSDNIFSKTLNSWLSKGKPKDNEPINSSLITCVIAFFFIAVGDIDFVAQIISMFFMVTYGAICSISFLEHLSSDPSYRPTFKSRWYFSLGGAILCFYLMFKMNTAYAFLSLSLMVGIYLWVKSSHPETKSIVRLGKGLIFQITRELQVFLQKRDREENQDAWRPFVISISPNTFQRRSGIDLVRWVSHRYGFGTYIHFIEGFLSEETYKQSQNIKERLVQLLEKTKSKVVLDTIISPSYTSAIAQSIQLSGVSGKGNNLILFEFTQTESQGVTDFVNNFGLLQATPFDVCILRTTLKGFGYQKEIHVWISPEDYLNSNLMILLAYIILGHPEWKKGVIKIFSVYPDGEMEQQKQSLIDLVSSGRLPISTKNINLIPLSSGMSYGETIADKSTDADLTIVGFNGERLKSEGADYFKNFPENGNMLFVNAFRDKTLT